MFSSIAITKPQKFAKKNLQGQYCLSPWVGVLVGLDGSVFLCGCDAWLPTPIGNLYHNSLISMLQSQVAQDIRQSVISGSYDFCNEKTCGVINNHQLITKDRVPPNILPLLENAGEFVMPYEITITGDLTCNLSCPSCRTKIIKNSPDQHLLNQSISKKLANNIFSIPTNQSITLALSSSGELFASPLLLDFVAGVDYEKFPNVKLKVQTNGLLCKKNWHKLGSAQHRVKHLTITFDAAEPETYEILRRGGSWSQLIEALNFLSDRKTKDTMQFHTRMVVQKQNYQQMLAFYDMSLKFNADRVEYIRLTDWGTYGNTFINHDVFDPQHPEHNQAMSIRDQVKLLPKSWLAGGL